MGHDSRVVRLAEKAKNLAQHTILQAARDLMRSARGDGFTMRELAEAAGVSLVTPYNHFGSKFGVMRALVNVALAEIQARYQAAPPPEDPLERVLLMAQLGVDVLVEDDLVLRRASGALLAGNEVERSTDLRAATAGLWRHTLDADFPLRPCVARLGLDPIATQLSVIFRGALTYWVAGEIDSDQFRRCVDEGTATVLLAFVDEAHAPMLAKHLAGSGTPPRGARKSNVRKLRR